MKNKNKEEVLISVFTPTFNRCESLKKTYNSLLEQTSFNFEWIVIDDGSTDETKSFVESIIKNNKFKIIYKYQENQGKHIAQNTALELANGELFLPLDSDDTCVAKTIETFSSIWNSLLEKEKERFSGIGCHCMTKEGKRIGKKWPIRISNDLEMHFKYKMDGEKWGIIKTNIMKEYLNPQVKGNYLSESLIWFQIAEKYAKLYVDEDLRIYEISQDSLTNKNNKKEYDKHNLESKIYSAIFSINHWSKWYIKYELIHYILMCINLVKKYTKANLKIILSKDSLLNNLKPISAKCIIIVVAPLSIVWKIKK